MPVSRATAEDGFRPSENALIFKVQQDPGLMSALQELLAFVGKAEADGMKTHWTLLRSVAPDGEKVSEDNGYWGVYRT